MSQDPSRPLPSLKDPDTGPFWEATRDHLLRFQRCASCGSIVFHPRRHCTNCLSTDLVWETSKGEGVIYTFSIVRQSWHPFFRGRTPYAVAWVDLDEGFRMMSNIVALDDPASELSVGQRVVVEWEDHEELSIPLFRPA